MKRILVTGGAGFIGSHLVENLLMDNLEVLVLDNFDPFYDPAVKENNILGHLDNPNYTLVRGDIRDRDKLMELFDSWKPEAVVHLAAKAGVRPSLEDPLHYVDVNINGTVNMLDASVKYGVKKFVFASSSSVYGLNEKVPFAEGDPILQPASPYGATKAAGEALCNSYSNCFKLPIVALRFFTVFGPRQRPDLAIHKFSKMIVQEHAIPLFGDGSTSRDYTFVKDIVAGIRKAMAYDLEGFEIFNLGNDRPNKLLELVQAIEEALGQKAKIEWLPLQIGDVPITWADLTKSRNLLGYEPTTSLREGLVPFVEWLKADSWQF